MTNPTSGGPVTVELMEGLPLHELHARLLLCLNLRETGTRGLAFFLADMDRRGLNQATRHRTTAHYAEGHLEMSRRHAQELIKVGNALRDLPAIDLAFGEGRLSWSKLAMLARVATPEHEQAWLERAERSTCRELRLAAMLGVGASTLLECVEPFLAMRGLVAFTPRGRVAVQSLQRLPDALAGR